MSIIITLLLVSLGIILQSDIPPGDTDYYTTAFIWMFIALLISVLK
jgi:hypothetical protein